MGNTCATLDRMKSVSLRELRQHTAALVRRAEHGEHINITVSGRPAARLVPIVAKQWQTWDAIAGLFDGPADPDWSRDRDLLDHSLESPWDRA